MAAAALETQENQPDGMTGDPRRLRTDLMCAHDGSLAQDEHGAFLPPSGVIEQTLRLSSPYHDEIDPEVFAERYKAIADRYPTLARSPESPPEDIEHQEPETHTELTSSGLAPVALALLASKSRKILPAILAISLALAGCSEATSSSTPDVVSPPTLIVQPLTPAPSGEQLASAISIPSETSTPTATATETATEKPPTPKPPTKEPTIVPTQQAPTEVAPTLAPAPTNTPQPEQPPPPPAGGYNFQKEGNQFICRLCPWNESLIYSPNMLQISLSTGDSATQSITNTFADLSPDQFLSEVNRLKQEGYQPMSMGIWQGENIGDPSAVGLQPHAVWYYMQR